jgi:hypothetical protein
MYDKLNLAKGSLALSVKSLLDGLDFSYLWNNVFEGVLVTDLQLSKAIESYIVNFGTLDTMPKLTTVTYVIKEKF